MQVENPIRLVRELKGAPISILLVLGFAGQRVTQEWLERATGYTDKPVSQALQYLREIGLVDHTRSGWMLTGEAKQLPLGLALNDGTRINPDDTDKSEVEEENPQIEESEMSRKYSDSLITTTIKDSELKIKSSSSSNNGEASRNFSESELELALKTAGIKGVKLRSLLSQGGFCPQDVPAWEHELQKRYKNRYTPGLLVRVLESGEQAPPMPGRGANGHFEDCECGECVRGKYET